MSERERWALYSMGYAAIVGACIALAIAFPSMTTVVGAGLTLPTCVALWARASIAGER